MGEPYPEGIATHVGLAVVIPHQVIRMLDTVRARVSECWSGMLKQESLNLYVKDPARNDAL